MNKALFFFILALCMTVKVQSKNISVGVIEYPPHTYIVDGAIKGPALLYMRRVLEKNYQSINFYYVPHKRGVLELNKGIIDILFPIKKKGTVDEYLSKSLFHSVPGLCFKKNNFIPFLSSTRLFKDLIVAVPSGDFIVPSLTESKAIIKPIFGSDITNRSINMLLKDRIDSFYHPNPINIYHYTNKLSKKIACSYFYGYSTGLFVGLSPKLSKDDAVIIEKTYSNFIKNSSYEYFFAEGNYKKEQGMPKINLKEKLIKFTEQ